MLSTSNRMKEINPFYVMSLLSRAGELEREGRDIIHLEIGEPDFISPPAVIKAGMRSLSSGAIKYTAAAGLPELRSAIAAYYKSHYKLNIPAERIFITPGASGALLLALGVLLNAGDQVVMADPSYPCYRNMVRLFDSEPKLVATGPEEEYQLNADLIRHQWEPSSRIVLVASPSNPTGTIISSGNLQEIAALVDSLGGCVISDEIYHGLEYESQAQSMLAFSDQALVVNSFSKFFGMTGWRVGWLVVPNRLIDAVDKLAQNIFISAPSPSQYAALASFEADNLTELDRRRLEFKSRRDYLYSHLTRLGFNTEAKPGGAFYIYADCSRFGMCSSKFTELLLEQNGVALTPGKDFGVNAPGTHLRFAYTTSSERIAEAVERLGAFINYL